MTRAINPRGIRVSKKNVTLCHIAREGNSRYGAQVVMYKCVFYWQDVHTSERIWFLSSVLILRCGDMVN